ncbi:MAG: amino acid adenylation domain-containing protein, partial [Chthoniobacterales bacterium]
MKEERVGSVALSSSLVDHDEDRASSCGDARSSQTQRRRQLSSAERRKVIFDWNQTRAEYPRDRCLHHLIEAQAERTPEAIAVEDESRVLTYRELNERANRLAHELQSRGVGPEILVGICLEPSTDLLAALLAVMKAGGAYVPLDPSYPPERLAFMVRDSGMQLVISQEKLSALLPREGVQILHLDAPLSKDENHARNPRSAAVPENLVYVIYTSGSTGMPKGVMVTHRGLVNYLVWAARAYDIAKGRGAPVHSSISFDLTITALFTSLLVGRTVRMLPSNLDSLDQALHSETPFSLVKITPAHLELLWAQRYGDNRPAATRSFIVGGEALFGRSLDFWRRCAPEATLVNEYGPTETVVGCCVYFVPPNGTFDGAIPIGRPIANTQLYVLDEFLEPVAIGEVGELYVAGDGVARGYLNQPELS